MNEMKFNQWGWCVVTHNSNEYFVQKCFDAKGKFLYFIILQIIDDMKKIIDIALIAESVFEKIETHYNVCKKDQS